MADNLNIRKLRKSLADTLNDSLLPIEVKRMILNDILNEVNQLAEREIQKEIAEEQKESEDVENGGICENAMEHNNSI